MCPSSPLDIPSRRIRARFLVVDGHTIIDDGWVTVTGEGVVRALGSVQKDPEREGGCFDDEIEGIVCASMVNAHSHLDWAVLAGKVPGGEGLHPWLSTLMPLGRSCTDAQRQAGMESAAKKLVDSGCGWIGDLANRVCDGLDPAPILAEAGLLGVVFHELLGITEERAQEALSCAEQPPPAPPGILRRLAPHAPYSCSEGLLRALLKVPDDQNSAAFPSTLGSARRLVGGARRLVEGRVSMHLAEDAAEQDFLLRGEGPWAESMQAFGWEPGMEPGQRSIAWLDSLGFLGPELLAVHLTDAGPEELTLLAQRGVSAVLCPLSNLHIGGQLPDLPAVLQAGLLPGLGTDSHASHPDLNLRSDTAALARAYPDLPLGTLWDMATRFGASALGLADSAGSLWPGRAPGILALETDPDENPLDVLLRQSERAPRLLVPAAPLPSLRPGE